MSLLLALAAFAGGVWLLVESVERLVGVLSGWAGALGVSGVVLSALVLGLDLEATAAGVAASLDDLPGTALGTSVGGAIFLVTVGLGLAAVVAPFELATPPRLLVAVAGATAAGLAVLLDGELSRLDGAGLLAAFAALLGLVASARGRAEPGQPRPSRPPRLGLRLAGGLAGLILGAELLVFGTGRIVAGLGISETVFGLLVVGAAVSFEEVVLELLPAHRGHPEISVGNALGTLVFLLTGSLGIIALARPVPVPEAVRAYHAPVLAGLVLLLLLLLARGRMGRREGTLLLGAYPCYLAGALLV